MENEEIYHLKIYNFTEVCSKSDTAPDLGSKIHCTDTHLYLHSCSFYPLTEKLHPQVWRYNLLRNKWSVVHDLGPESREVGFTNSALWCDILFLRTCAFPAPSSRAHQLLCFSDLRKCSAKMDFVAMTPRSHADISRALISGDMVHPPQCKGYAMVVHRERLYVVGGSSWNHDSSAYSMDVYAFHFKRRKWAKLFDSAANNDHLPGRVGHAMVYYKHQLYIFGGFTKFRALPLQEIPVFDLKKRTWSVLQTTCDPGGFENFPFNRGHHAIAQNPHQLSLVFIHGGCTERVTPMTVFKHTWRIDLDQLRWTRISTLTTSPRFLHSMSATPDGRMYLFGGASQTRVSRKVFVAWITIPKLVDICWDAYMFYIRKGVFKLPDDLKTSQLPTKYLNRLMCD